MHQAAVQHAAEHQAVATFELVFVLLLAVVVLHWAALRLKLPPSVALLLGGTGIAFLPGVPVIVLDPELVLLLFLPPLLMDGAYGTAFGQFKRQLMGILMLAFGAVVFTTLVVGLVAHWLVPGLPWAACFALGAIVSPPDAVSARAVLQRVKLPRRLTALLEGESLLNDATGLVLFRFAAAALLSTAAYQFDAGAAVMDFAWLAIGGVVVGTAIGGAWMFLLPRLGDEFVTIAAALLLCWTAYIAGEQAGVSGVISTVTAGLIFGWYQHVVFTARVRMQSTAFWQTMVFLLEALVFILIGSSLRGVLDRVGGPWAVIEQMALPIAGVVAAMIVARFVWVFGGDLFHRMLCKLGLRGRPLGWRSATVLSWAGMRGVVTLAVALTLPEHVPDHPAWQGQRDLMLVAAFAAIGVTVLLQGTSLGLLIAWLKPADMEPPAPMDMPATEAAIARAQYAEVQVKAYAVDGTLIHPRLLEQYQKRAENIVRYSEDSGAFTETIAEHFEVVLAAIAAGRAELVRLHRAGQIEDDVLHELERDLDIEELRALAMFTTV